MNDVINDVMHIFYKTVLYFSYFRAHTYSSIEYHRYLGLQVLKFDYIRV